MDFILVALISGSATVVVAIVLTLVVIVLARENGRLRAELKRRPQAPVQATGRQGASGVDAYVSAMLFPDQETAVKLVADLQLLKGRSGMQIAREAVVRAVRDMQIAHRVINTQAVVLAAQKYVA